jgi:hypothetical protein
MGNCSCNRRHWDAWALDEVSWAQGSSVEMAVGQQDRMLQKMPNLSLAA